MGNSPPPARAHPKEIRIVESYRFRVDVGGLEQVRPDGKPEGQIEVAIPYDGHAYFTRDAREDVTDAVAEARRREKPQLARIGFLGITDHEYTDLDQQEAVQLQHRVLPLDVPVYNEALKAPESLQDGRHVCRLILPYHPRPLSNSPLQVTVTIEDEESLLEEQLRLLQPDLAETRAERLQYIGRQLASEAGFYNYHNISFRAVVDVPAPPSADALPILSRVSFDWPAVASPRLIRLSAAGKPYPLHYDPVNRVIEWENIPLTPLEREERTRRCQYTTPSLTLRLAEPGELVQLSALRGKLRVRLPWLISGLNVHPFDALGRPASHPLVQESRLEADLRLALADCFRNRPFSPAQRLQFHGMPLSERRIATLVDFLEMERFTIVRQLSLAAAPGEQSLLIVAQRAEGPGNLWLWVRLDGNTAGREPGFVVHLRAELPGDRKRPVQVLTELHRQLKRQFELAGSFS